MKIMFVCLGNICRSPMAEFIMRDLLKKEGLSELVLVSSSATSYEEIGNPPHPGTRRKLSELGILTQGKYAVKFKKEDYDSYDYIIGMDSQNIKDILRIVGNDRDNKVYKLLDFASGGDISDPWYTGDFEETYCDVLKGTKGLLAEIKEKIKK